MVVYFWINTKAFSFCLPSVLELFSLLTDRTVIVNKINVNNKFGKIGNETFILNNGLNRIKCSGRS